MKKIFLLFSLSILFWFAVSQDIYSDFIDDINISILSWEKNDYEFNQKLRTWAQIPIMTEELKDKYKKVWVEVRYKWKIFLAKLDPIWEHQQHFMLGKVWSFSLEFNDSSLFWNLKIKLYPIYAKWLNHYAVGLVAKEFWFPIQSQKFANIYFNWKKEWLYYIVENFNKDFLINNSLDENVEIYEEANSFIPSGSIFTWYKDQVLYWKKKIKVDNSWDFLNNAFVLFKSKKIDIIKYLFDLDNLLKINSVHVLAWSHHQDYLHNNILFYNRSKGVLWFLLWDNFLHNTMWDKNMIDEYYNYLIEFLLEDPQYFYKRNKLLYDYVSNKNLIKNTELTLEGLYNKISSLDTTGSPLSKDVWYYYTDNVAKIKAVLSKIDVDVYKNSSELVVKNYGFAPVEINIPDINYKYILYPYLKFDRNKMFSKALIDSEELKIKILWTIYNIEFKNILTNEKKNYKYSDLLMVPSSKSNIVPAKETLISSYINNYWLQIKLNNNNYLFGSILLRSNLNGTKFSIPDYFSKKWKFDLYFDENENSIIDEKDPIIDYLIKDWKIYFELPGLIKNWQIFIIWWKNYILQSWAYNVKSDYQYFEQLNDYENNLQTENITYEINWVVNKPILDNKVAVDLYYEWLKYLDVNKLWIKVDKNKKESELFWKEIKINYNWNSIIAKFEKIEDNYAYFDFTWDKFVFSPIPLPNDIWGPISPKILRTMEIEFEKWMKTYLDFEKLIIDYDDIKWNKRELEIKNFYDKSNIYKFEKIDNSIITKISNNMYRIKSWNYELNDTIILPKGSVLTIDPWTIILMWEWVSILSYWQINSLWTKLRPIIIKSKDMKKSFGTVWLMQESAIWKFRNTYFIKWWSAFINWIDISWMLSAHYAKNISIDNCIFALSQSDDWLNIKNSKFEVKNSIFFKNSADWFDVDFWLTWSQIINNKFLENWNDWLDLSYSDIIIRWNTMQWNGDKWISVWERTKSLILNNTISKNNIWIEIKDESSPYIFDNTINNNNVWINLYIKKQLYWAPYWILYWNKILNNEIKQADGWALKQLSYPESVQIKNQYLSNK